jgi:long-subunit acyl-CoA synthetase (AMP-forming)
MPSYGDFPSPDVEIRIGSIARALPERCVGDLWVRGPDVADGHLNDSAGGQFVGEWLRTADLGYLADGEPSS